MTRSQKDAVRPKCDTDAEELAQNEINIDAVRPKRDLDAEAFDDDGKNKQEREHGAAAAKQNTLEVNEEVSFEDLEIKRLIEERKTTAIREKQRLKELTKQIRKCIRD